jgi:hypothetical protein
MKGNDMKEKNGKGKEERGGGVCRGRMGRGRGEGERAQRRRTCISSDNEILPD